MPRPTIRVRPFHAAVLSLLVASVVPAQPLTEPLAKPQSGPSAGELGALRLRYGVALRDGGYSDAGAGLSYSGLTPNDLALLASFYGKTMFGVVASAAREGFSLLDTTTSAPVTRGSLWRGSIGPAARLLLGPVRLEGTASYGFAQLPSFGNSSAPGFALGRRHSALLGARAGLDLGKLFVEVRGEYPVVLAATDAAGNRARTTGYAAGASLGWRFGNFGKVLYGLVLDYQYVKDSLVSPAASTGTVDITSTQVLSRVGVALDFRLMDKAPPPPPPRFGSLLVTVVDDKTGEAMRSAPVVLTAKGRSRNLAAGQDGNVRIPDLDPGEVMAAVSIPEYLPAEGRATVVAGQSAELVVRAKRVPPKMGGLVLIITEKGTTDAVANAQVTIGGKAFTPDAQGKVVAEGLPVGPVQVKIEAPEFRVLTEIASIINQKTTEMPVEMVLLKARIPASISGLVRSTAGGRPVTADLEMPELNQRAKASGNGAFSFQVRAGTYRVIISAPGYLTQTKNVTVKEGDQAIFNVDLHPQKQTRTPR